jgi:c(7)-type cytochrome triheme protein
MRRNRFVTSILVAAFALGAALVAPADAQKPPPDFALKTKDGSPGPVTFSHEKHKEGAEKCTACHTKIFKMKKDTTPDMTMAKMNAGQSCGTCHNGKTEVNGKKVFATADKDKCETCHKKQ